MYFLTEKLILFYLRIFILPLKIIFFFIDWKCFKLKQAKMSKFELRRDCPNTIKYFEHFYSEQLFYFIGNSILDSDPNNFFFFFERGQKLKGWY